MLNRPIDQIDENYINQIVQANASESIYGDFKETVELDPEDESKRDSDRKKREARRDFLEDIVSFANTSGGNIFIGIKEERNDEGKKTGRAEEAIGVAWDQGQFEDFRNKVLSIIDDGVRPKISNVRIGKYGNYANGPVVVINVPKSWLAPHMIKFGSTNNFYTRTDTGNRPLDYNQIRDSFLGAAELPDRIRKFRSKRVELFFSGQTTHPMNKSPLMVLHIVPLSQFASKDNIDLACVHDYKDLLEPICLKAHSHMFSADGYSRYSSLNDGTVHTYLQVFRSGIIETVGSHKLFRIEPEDNKIVDAYNVEQVSIAKVKQIIEFYKTLNIVPPLIVMLSLVNVKLYNLRSFEPHKANDSYIEDKFQERRSHNIKIPDICIDYDEDVSKSLKPMFDMMWQAFGFQASHNYNDDGTWKFKNGI